MGSQAARKQSRYRARLRSGRVILLETPIDEVVEALLRAGRLTERQALDRSQVERAVAEVVTEWSQKWLGAE